MFFVPARSVVFIKSLKNKDSQLTALENLNDCICIYDALLQHQRVCWCIVK